MDQKKTPLFLSKRIAFTVITLAGAWLFAELVVFVSWYGKRDSPSDWKTVYQAHPYKAFAPVPNTISRSKTISRNSLGLRGPEIKVRKSTHTIRIVCIGGSTTLCYYATSDTTTYPARMETILRAHYRDRPFRIEVINAGVEAYNSLEGIINFQTCLLDLSPDVAVFHHVLNDAWDMIEAHGFQSDFTHLRCNFRMRDPRWWEWSPLLSFCFAYKMAFNPYFPDRNANLIEMAMVQPEILHDSRVRRIAGLTPEMTAAYERNIRTFLALARGNGVIPVLSTEVFLDDRPQEHMFESTQTFNDVVRAICRSESVGLIDFDQVMDHSWEAFIDPCHLKDTPEGLGFKGEFFAKEMIRLDVVTEAWEQRAARCNDPARP
jgi:hypothetical protein